MPSTTAVSSPRSRSSASRSRAPRNATASSCRASWATRTPSGSGSRPSAAQRPSRIVGGSSDSDDAPGRRARSPPRPARVQVVESRSRDRRRAVAPDRRQQRRARARPRRPSQSAPRSTPPGAPPRALTDRPRPSSDPPEASELAELVLGEQGVGLALGVLECPPTLRVRAPRSAPGGVGSFVHRPPSAHEQQEGTRRRPGRGGRPTARRAASRARAGRRGRASSASRRAGRTTAARHAASGVLARLDGLLEGVRGRRERVEDRLVARLAPATTGEPVGRGAEHRGDGRPVQRRRPRPATKPGLDAGRAVQRPRRAADRRDQAMPDRLEELAGRCLGGQIGQQLVDRPEADDEVVAVVAVAENRVEPGQARAWRRDDPSAASEPGPQRDGVERSADAGDRRWQRRSVDGDGTVVPRAVGGRPSVGGVGPVRQRSSTRAPPERHFIASADATLLAS